MTLSFKDLHDVAGLDTDGAAGFEAQVALRSHKRKAIPPEHLQGRRHENFEHGASIARDWMAVRRGVGAYRKSVRAKELKLRGGVTTMKAQTAKELREEQVGALRQIAELRNRIRAAVEADDAAPSDG